MQLHVFVVLALAYVLQTTAMITPASASVSARMKQTVPPRWGRAASRPTRAIAAMKVAVMWGRAAPRPTQSSAVTETGVMTARAHELHLAKEWLSAGFVAPHEAELPCGEHEEVDPREVRARAEGSDGGVHVAQEGGVACDEFVFPAQRCGVYGEECEDSDSVVAPDEDDVGVAVDLAGNGFCCGTPDAGSAADEDGTERYDGEYAALAARTAVIEGLLLLSSALY
ncbi:hypothetical protein B0H13DRAFT_2342402 [Mycena leptocephala]|nr:hypothetical protein B0H13DRAFT_2342402 [Mycena leptocephala]